MQHPRLQGVFAHLLSALRPVILLFGRIIVTLGLSVGFVKPFITTGDTCLKRFLFERVPREKAKPVNISELSCSCLN